MYKHSAGVFSILLILIASGCASSGQAIFLAEKEPIALVSVVSNAGINWRDEEPISNPDANVLFRLSLRKDPDLTLMSNAGELITTAESLIRNTLAFSPQMIIAESGAVTGSNAYRNARQSRTFSADKMVSSAGLQPIFYRDKDFLSALANETGIRYCMFIEFNFTTAMVTGLGKIGKARACIDMLVTIVDTQGKALYSKSFYLGSDLTFSVSFGEYSHSELIDIFESTIQDICYKFMDDLGI